MRLYLLILLVMNMNSPALAQSDLKEILAADELFNTQRYSQAYYAYNTLLQKQPANAWINYRLGACYLNSRSQKPRAIPYLEKAIELSGAFITQPRKGVDAPAVTYKLLGDAYCIHHRFELAISAYTRYKELAVPEKEALTIEDADQKIEICKLGKELKESFSLPETLRQFSKKNGGNYTAAVSPDKSSMVYTLKVPLNRLQQPEEDGKYFEELPLHVRKDSNFFRKTITEEPKKPNKNFPDTIITVATIGSSSDGQIVLTYRTEGDNAELYISRLSNNRWTNPVRLARNSNTRGWEPGEYISADGNTMYFVSDKKGGFGGKDIYRCVKQPGGEWGKAVNLGPGINSPYDDVAPFLHSDGQTLYFSSNRNSPSRGFDIFMATRADSINWSKPVVAGYPVDYSNNSSFYQVSASASSGTASARQVKKYQSDSLEATIQDNYVISFNDKKMGKLTLLKGRAVSQSTNNSGPVRITVTDNLTGAMLGVFYADEKTGEYSFILPPGTNNYVLFETEGCVFASENVIVGKEDEMYQKLQPVSLERIAEGASIRLNNIVFEAGTASMSPVSRTELQQLVAFCRSHPEMELRIHNYMTGPGKKESRKLSRKRAQMVAAHLVVSGIDKERIHAEGFYRKPAKAGKKKSEAGREPELLKEQELILQIGKLKRINLRIHNK